MQTLKSSLTCFFLIQMSKFLLRLDWLISVQNFWLKCSHLHSLNLMISTFTNSSIDIVSKYVCIATNLYMCLC